MVFPCGSAGKESACNAGDLGSISGLGRSPGEEKGYPLQYSSLENSMDCIVHGVTKSQTQLIDSHFHCHFQSQIRCLHAPLCMVLCDPMVCSPPGSSVWEALIRRLSVDQLLILSRRNRVAVIGLD